MPPPPPSHRLDPCDCPANLISIPTRGLRLGCTQATGAASGGAFNLRQSHHPTLQVDRAYAFGLKISCRSLCFFHGRCLNYVAAPLPCRWPPRRRQLADPTPDGPQQKSSDRADLGRRRRRWSLCRPSRRKVDSFVVRKREGGRQAKIFRSDFGSGQWLIKQIRLFSCLPPARRYFAKGVKIAFPAV